MFNLTIEVDISFEGQQRGVSLETKKLLRVKPNSNQKFVKKEEDDKEGYDRLLFVE